jgi:3-hydroxybutyryl-CoA dehydratase
MTKVSAAVEFANVCCAVNVVRCKPPQNMRLLVHYFCLGCAACETTFDKFSKQREKMQRSWCRLAGKIVRVGDAHSVTRTFTQTDVTTFAHLIGDCNPIHLDIAAAQKAGFPNTICHGVLVGSLFSTIMGMHLPGAQSVYLQQSFQFVAPVFVGEEVTATVRVREFHREKKMLWLDTTVSKRSQKEGEPELVCIQGTALGLNKTLQLEGESAWTYVRPKY